MIVVPCDPVYCYIVILFIQIFIITNRQTGPPLNSNKVKGKMFRCSRLRVSTKVIVYNSTVEIKVKGK